MRDAVSIRKRRAEKITSSSPSCTLTVQGQQWNLEAGQNGNMYLKHHGVI